MTFTDADLRTVRSDDAGDGSTRGATPPADGHAEYKQAILAEYDTLHEPGAKGAAGLSAGFWLWP